MSRNPGPSKAPSGGRGNKSLRGASSSRGVGQSPGRGAGITGVGVQQSSPAVDGGRGPRPAINLALSPEEHGTPATPGGAVSSTPPSRPAAKRKTVEPKDMSETGSEGEIDFTAPTTASLRRLPSHTDEGDKTVEPSTGTPKRIIRKQPSHGALEDENEGPTTPRGSQKKASRKQISNPASDETVGVAPTVGSQESRKQPSGTSVKGIEPSSRTSVRKGQQARGVTPRRAEEGDDQIAKSKSRSDQSVLGGIKKQSRKKLSPKKSNKIVAETGPNVQGESKTRLTAQRRESSLGLGVVVDEEERWYGRDNSRLVLLIIVGLLAVFLIGGIVTIVSLSGGSVPVNGSANTTAPTRPPKASTTTRDPNRPTPPLPEGTCYPKIEPLNVGEVGDWCKSCTKQPCQECCNWYYSSKTTRMNQILFGLCNNKC